MLNEELLLSHDHSSSTAPDPDQPPGTPSQWSVPQHWKDLPLNILSIFPVLVGLSHYHKCDSIPLLPLFLICFGGINIIRSIVSFYWRVPRDFRKMDRKVTATKVVVGSGRVLIGVAVWGGVLTLRDVGDHFPDGGDHCSRAVYLSGFLASVCTLSIFAIILTILIGRYIRVACCKNGRKHRDIRFFYESYYSSDSESSSEPSSYSDEEQSTSF